MPVYLVLRVQEVNVPGGAHRLAQLLAQPDDGAVELPQLLLVSGLAVPEHEGVVAQGLDLQKVIKGGDALQLRPVPAVCHRLEQLSGLAGGAHDQPLPVLYQLVLGDQGEAFQIFQVGHGDQLVEVFQSHLVFRDKNDVLGLPVGVAPFPQGRHGVVDCLEGVDVQFFFHALEEVGQEQAAGGGVVTGPVVLEGGEPQVLRHDVQLIFSQLRQQVLGQDQRIHVGRIEVQSLLAAPLPDKADVELRVVRHQRPPVSEGEKIFQSLGGLGRALEHLVRDAGEGDDLVAEVPLRVHEGLKPVRDLPAADDHRANFGNGLLADLQAGGLNVEGYVFIGKGRILGPVDGDAVVQVVDEVPLHAVEDLDVLGGVPRIREPLDHAVVRDGDGGVAPGLRPHDDVPRRSRLGTEGGEGIHVGEGGVGVELHPLDLRLVLTHLVGVGGDVLGVQQDVAAVPVELDVPLDLHPQAGLHVLLQPGLFLLLQILGHPDGGLEVRHVEGQAEDPRAAGLVEVGKEHLPRHHHVAHLGIQSLHGLDRALDGNAHDDLAALRLLTGGRGGGGDRLVNGHPLQGVGRCRGGGQLVFFLPQVGPDGEGQVHGPALPRHFDSCQKSAVQKGAEVPGQGEAGEQLEKGDPLHRLKPSLSS